MNLSERFDVSEAKVQALKERILRLKIDLSKIVESFTRGGGKGGQKINKTSNCVVLRYRPLDLTVKCGRERKRTVNRFLALRELVDRIELRVSPQTSKRKKEIDQARRRKSRRRRKSAKKYTTEGAGPGSNRETPSGPRRP